MEHELSYIENNLKAFVDLYPEYYDHILSGEELSDYIFMLMNKHSSSVNRKQVISDSEDLITGDFFLSNMRDIIANTLSDEQRNAYRDSFSKQNENSFFTSDYDISVSRMIRYMPAQWHSSSYFFVYFARFGNCDILFRNNDTVTLKKGELLILAPFVEHATPCYADDAILEYFLVRSSSFERVFWDQLNKDSIMSHFFRNALRSEGNNTTSYLLFDTGCDGDIVHLIDQIKEEIRLKLPYSSSLINSLMSALFSLTLRRYEDSVIISSDDNERWKKEYSKIFHFIQNNYTKASLQEVAEACGYSSKQVSRIVYSYFKMNYSDLITFLKMDKAASMIKEKTASMEDISAFLGYSDLPSFYRAFKKYYRTTPAQYLRQEGD